MPLTGEVKAKIEYRIPWKKRLIVENVKKNRQIVLEPTNDVAEDWYNLIYYRCHPDEWKDLLKEELEHGRDAAAAVVKRIEIINYELKLRLSERKGTVRMIGYTNRGNGHRISYRKMF